MNPQLMFVQAPRGYGCTVSMQSLPALACQPNMAAPSANICTAFCVIRQFPACYAITASPA